MLLTTGPAGSYGRPGPSPGINPGGGSGHKHRTEEKRVFTSGDLVVFAFEPIAMAALAALAIVVDRLERRAGTGR